MKITKVRNVKTPSRANPTDSGIDFYIPDDINTIIPPRDSITIPSGIKVELTKGTDLVFHNKSGIASKNGVILGACVVDYGFSGEIEFNLINTSGKSYQLQGGNKIIQGIIRKVELEDVVEVTEEEIHKEKTPRGEGKLGSTGLK